MNREKFRQENQAIQRRYETKYFPRVKAAIQSKVDEVKGVVANRGVSEAMNYLTNQVSNTKVTTIVQAMDLEVGLRFARRQWTDLQAQKRTTRKAASVPYEIKGFGFNAAWTAWIKDFLFDFIVQKISFSVFETTKDVLFTVLNNAITNGWGVDETVKALDELPLSRTQAARIVRTEITRAANAGAMAAGSTFEFQQVKEWIAAHDTRVRGFRPEDHASHKGLDGQTVDYEDVFRDPRNGDELMFPGDPGAMAESTINCRCSVAVVAKVGEDGRLIPKRQTTTVIYPRRNRTQIVTI